jgi:hypothetical protein
MFFSFINMKRVFFCHLFILSASISFAQNDSVSIASDSIPAKLLPENLSPLKRVLWGERGLMRITGIVPLNSENREKELKLRRKMLNAHQILGLTTLGAMVLADYSGQKALNGSHHFVGIHKKVVGVTIGTYFLTAAAALLAPPPLIVRKNWNNIKTHKLLAYLHFTGMILTPILAPHLAGHSYGQQGEFHQISAYITTAIYASAIIVLKF